MREELRERCRDVILRLPSIAEFEYWYARLDKAQTEAQLLEVATALSLLVYTYRVYQGIDVRQNRTIFEREGQ